MVAAVISKLEHLDGIRRLARFEIRYYVEEYCGKDGCAADCMGFDWTSQCTIDVPFEVMKNQTKFRDHVKVALIAHCKEKWPFKHDIPEDEIFLCPSTF